MNPFDYCFEQVSRWDRIRALALRYAPKGTQDGALALYALNLELAKVAPLVTEPTLGEIRFLWWQEALQELQSEQQARNHPVVLALSQASQSHSEILNHALALLDGWRQTSQQTTIEDWPALETCLLATHGRLASGVIGLAGSQRAGDTGLSDSFALAWGYASLRHALLAKGELELLPKQARAQLETEQTSDPLAVGATELERRAAHAYGSLRKSWGRAQPHHRALLSCARLIPVRLTAPDRAEDLAAWRLFSGQFARQLPELGTQ